MTKDQIASTITRLSEESAAAEMHRTVSELESVISDLRTSAARLKRIPGQPTIPDGYVDAKTACAVLNISRSRLDKLADNGKIRRVTVGWKTAFALTDLLSLYRGKVAKHPLSTSPKSAPERKMTPEQ